MKTRGSHTITKDLVLPNPGGTTPIKGRVSYTDADGKTHWEDVHAVEVEDRVYPYIGSLVTSNTKLYISIVEDADGTAITDTAQWSLFSDASGSAATGLKAIDDGNGTAWILIGKDSANYGPAGKGSINFSDSTAPSSVMGPTGEYSAAFGKDIRLPFNHTLAIGLNINGVVERGYNAANLIISDGDLTINSAFSNSIVNAYSSVIGTPGAVSANVWYTSMATGWNLDIPAARGSGYVGIGLKGSAPACFVVGQANIDLTVTPADANSSQNSLNPRFIVGTGTWNTNPAPGSGVRGTGFWVRSDGSSFFPALTDLLIDEAGDDSAITKGWHKNQAATKLNEYTVATLPGTPSLGDIAFVTDASSPLYLNSVSGGGATNCPVFYDGINWVCH